jgi:hypothetical protein
MFFSEEKNQTTFALRWRMHTGYGRDPSAGAGIKVFWFFS